MAPFLTHLVVGEQVWQALAARRPGQDGYGTFLFGCLAADVDKYCPGLEQSTTHFLPKDEAGTWAWRRSQHFLDHQVEFLRAPFSDLGAGEQAFVIGYLCHVATDEITGRLARRLMRGLAAAGGTLPNVDALLTVMDPRCWALAGAPQAIAEALASALIPERTLPFAPLDCLAAMHQIVLPQVREGGGLEPYVRMVRRHRQWLRHGLVSDAPDDAELEADLAAYRRTMEVDLPASERLVAGMDLAPFVEEAVQHSTERIMALWTGEAKA